MESLLGQPWYFYLFVVALVAAVMILPKRIGPKIKLLPDYGNITGNNYATVIFRKFFKIKKIDGNEVFLSVFGAKAGSIKIHPGKHTFNFSYNEEGVGSGDNLTATGDFLSGKKYFLRANFKQDSFMKKTVFAEFLEFHEDSEIKEYLSKSYKKES